MTTKIPAVFIQEEQHLPYLQAFCARHELLMLSQLLEYSIAEL